MPNTPLNPDALEVAERWMQEKSATFGLHWKNAKPIIEAYLAVAQPVVTSVEELDALPIGSVILSERYIARQEGEEYPGVFQKLYTGDWHRGGRSSDTHPDYFLPARVLYRPEVKG